ncbi:MAG: bifunctional oligoribonuclease/PAP phosphatase NrnA [Treponema sp.]|nr:bifunctional oligoribonuclease/PAP phosphatase NrnA [Treponema sp.]MCL2266363.1 bifunctional oligoribonuclease/PAP phosphatase NrnA [Treponema sp.]
MNSGSSVDVQQAERPAMVPAVPGELVEFIKACPKFIIAGHKEPDGDCVGSQLALRSALLRLGKEVVVCSAGPFNRTELKKFTDFFISIPSANEDESSHADSKEGSPGQKSLGADPDTSVLLLDCSGKERAGEIKNFLDKYPCAIIDHHAAVNHQPSTLQAPVFVDENSPSCTLLVYRLITALGLELTEDEATYLLFGLCTDTGFFRHMTEKHSEAFEAAAQMIKSGASPKKIHKIIHGGKSLNSRILLGRILSRIESCFDGKLLISYETLEEFNYFGYESRDSDTLNQLLLSTEGIQAVVIIRQECAENCTVSLRSSDKINVSQIAASLGGGGHRNAAGLTIKGDISFVKQKIIELFNKIFN